MTIRSLTVGWFCRFVAGAALLIGTAASANADAYPYSGAYAMGSQNAETSRWRKAACLTHFFTQTTKGRYALFHLDPRELMQNNRLRYVAYETGRCQHDKTDNIDVCVPHYNYRDTLDPYFMRYESRDYGQTRVLIGKTRREVSEADSSKFASDALVQLQCPKTRDQLKPFLTLKRTTYPKADVEILIGLFGLTPLLEFHRRVRAILDRETSAQ